MKKIILTIIFFVTAFLAYAQKTDADQITYEAKAIYIILKNDNGVEVAKKPLGKSAMIFHNKFFKSYQVHYTNENGELAFAKFSYINTDKFGRYRVKDPYGTMYFVKDEISVSNRLTFVGEEKAGEYFMEFFVDEFKR